MRRKTFSATRSSSGRQDRRGVATFWVIVAVPVILTLLVVVGDVANLRLARIEAENAVEAAALAGVKQWHEGGNSGSNRRAARAAAVAYGEANTVIGEYLKLRANRGSTDDNDNDSLSGNILLGKITGGSLLTFDHGSKPDPGQFGVHVQANVPVQSLFGNFGGFDYGPYSVTVQATALYDSNGEVRLVRINSFTP